MTTFTCRGYTDEDAAQQCPPDDEICCADTIAAHADAGWRARLPFLTKGETTEALGAAGADEIARMGIGHAAEAAAMLGAEVRFLDFPDTRIE